MLLEEDHALVQDSIQMMEHMEQLKCDGKECDLMSLGHYKNNLKLGATVSASPLSSSIDHLSFLFSCQSRKPT